MGEEESVVMERPFQSMNAVLSTSAKFRIWVRSWRGWREEREENMLASSGGGRCSERCAVCLFVEVAG